MKTLYEIKTNEDIVLLCNLASTIWQDYWKIILSQEQITYMLEKFQSPKAVKKQIEDEDYIYRIMKNNGENVGYFGVCKKDEHLFLSKLYIAKECRGKGFGRFAFLEIRKIAEDIGAKFIRLTVNKHNSNSIKAYEKWGFNVVDSCITDIGNNFVMDDYIMEFSL